MKPTTNPSKTLSHPPKTTANQQSNNNPKEPKRKSTINQMKKLYNSGKGANKRVHPSPSPLPTSSSSSFPLLSALPTALLALASALSAEEQEVLAYLLGCEKSKEKQQRKKPSNNKNKAHPPELGCSCFGCYKSFWARWDSSPNRHVIHMIIDAFEETLVPAETAAGKIKGKRQRKRSSKKMDEAVIEESMEVSAEKADDGHGDDDGYGDEDDEEEEEEEEEEMSSVRRFVSWVFGINN